MTKFRFSIVALAIVAITAVTAAAALATAQAKVVFAGKYAGAATTKVDGTTATIAANGKGTATSIGAGAITGLGTGDTSAQPCMPFTGTGKMTGQDRNDHLQGRPRLERLRRRRRSQLHDHIPPRRAEGDGEAPQGEGHPQADGRLQP